MLFSHDNGVNVVFEALIRSLLKPRINLLFSLNFTKSLGWSSHSSDGFGWKGIKISRVKHEEPWNVCAASPRLSDSRKVNILCKETCDKWKRLLRILLTYPPAISPPPDRNPSAKHSLQ